MRRAGLIIALTSALGGCASMQAISHVPLATMSRLSSMTLADIDPDQFRVAARLPAALEPRPQGVKVRIDRKSGKDGARHEDFVLEPVTQASELAPLSKHQRAGTRLSIFRLSSADAGRLRRIMAETNAPSSNAGVTIQAGVDACHRSPLGAAPLPTTTWLRTNASDYFVLAEDLDLRSIVPAADLAAKVPPCGA